jgi:hypothetical protein
MEFSYVPTILIILVVTEEHTFFNSEKGRQSNFMLFTQQNRVEMQARKLTTMVFTLTLCNHTGVPSVARLQREEMSTTQEEARETGTFSTGIYGGRASSLNLQTI